MASNYKRRYTKGTRFKPPRLSFSAWEYNPQGLQKYDEKTLRKEYTRLRDIAQKRLGRMGQTMFERSQTYRKNVGQFEKTRDIETASQLRQDLTQLARFVLAESSTIQGQKAIMKRGIATWHKKGYDWVNESNWFDFIDFLEYVKSHDKNVYTLDDAMDEFKRSLDAGEDVSDTEALFNAYVESTTEI